MGLRGIRMGLRRVGGSLYNLGGCTLYGSYPTGYSKDQKRSFGRKAKLNFNLVSIIMHASSVLVEERRWIEESNSLTTAEEERHRVIISANCHVSAEGKHRGDIYTVYVGAGG